VPIRINMIRPIPFWPDGFQDQQENGCKREAEQRRKQQCLATSFALVQSTPDVPLRPCSNALVTPTPMMEPTRVCELDAGRPKDQVPRFQRL
jgi:hypothetical protein